MTDVAEVAKGLTEDERRDLLAGNCVYGGQCYCASPYLKAFRSLGLAGARNENGDARPTDLGRAVRAHLEANP